MDYELQLKIRNAPMLNLMRSRGYKNAAELSRAVGISQSILGTMLSLKVTAYSGPKYVEPRAYVKKLAEFFGVSVEDLYPYTHLRDPLVQNKFEAQISAAHLSELSHSGTQDPLVLLEVFETECGSAFEDIISHAILTERERCVLRKRYVENKPYSQCGEDLDISQERVRQIEAKALRKMRHPSRSKDIKLSSGIYLEKTGLDNEHNENTWYNAKRKKIKAR